MRSHERKMFIFYPSILCFVHCYKPETSSSGSKKPKFQGKGKPSLSRHSNGGNRSFSKGLPSGSWCDIAVVRGIKGMSVTLLIL